uniref:Uncharacterized protein n=1 Tax=Arundo donax TaxID=35708 RepID=A0A0A9B566_ARUDO
MAAENRAAARRRRGSGRRGAWRWRRPWRASRRPARAASSTWWTRSSGSSRWPAAAPRPGA